MSFSWLRPMRTGDFENLSFRFVPLADLVICTSRTMAI